MKRRTSQQSSLRPPALRRWASAHARALFDSLGRLWRQPMASLLSTLVLGITLALPTALHVLLVNASVVGDAWHDSVRITVLLKDNVSDARAGELAASTQAQADIASARALSRSEALAEFERYSGLGEAVSLLSENPLPASVIVTPMAGVSAADVATLRDRLAQWPEADEVLLDSQWLTRLRALLDLMRTGVLLFAGALAVAVLVIVGNTIRLDVAARREEVEVMKLIGAPDSFIRRPFLYSGFWYGLIGALLALVLVGVGLLALATPVQQLASAYSAEFTLQGPSLAATLLVIAGGCLLGWLGAGIAVVRQLARFTPQ